MRQQCMFAPVGRMDAVVSEAGRSVTPLLPMLSECQCRLSIAQVNLEALGDFLLCAPQSARNPHYSARDPLLRLMDEIGTHIVRLVGANLTTHSEQR